MGHFRLGYEPTDDHGNINISLQLNGRFKCQEFLQGSTFMGISHRQAFKGRKAGIHEPTYLPVLDTFYPVLRGPRPVVSQLASTKFWKCSNPSRYREQYTQPVNGQNAVPTNVNT